MYSVACNQSENGLKSQNRAAWFDGKITAKKNGPEARFLYASILQSAVYYFSSNNW